MKMSFNNLAPTVAFSPLQTEVGQRVDFNSPKLLGLKRLRFDGVEPPVLVEVQGSNGIYNFRMPNIVSNATIVAMFGESKNDSDPSCPLALLTVEA